MLKVEWWQMFQVEIGGKWQLFPNRNMTWGEWAWSPFANCVWPGKPGMKRTDMPNGEIFGGLESRNAGKDLEFYSLIHWYSCGIRVLGLDIGVGLFIRTKQSIAKIESNGLKVAGT